VSDAIKLRAVSQRRPTIFVMLLTVSKRLEFSASRRLFVPDWSEEENLDAFGPETSARYGTGRNYIAYFILSGDPNPANGMLVNISEIKKRALQVVSANFDHKFLNEDHEIFVGRVPIVENIARQLFLETSPRFGDLNANLAAVHLVESPERSATFYSNEICDANYWFQFSAARRTVSPHLSPEENERLFGISTSLHGHNYRTRLTFRDTASVSYQLVQSAIHGLQQELDHKDLNVDVPGLRNRPLTTESLAQYIYERVSATLPVHRVRLHERDDFFAESWSDGNFFLGLRRWFSAAHRLQLSELSKAENISLFGKCSNPLGHGHLYEAEATIGGSYDERSGTLYNFTSMQGALGKSLQPWENKHLDLETNDFKKIPSTGENIVRTLWERLDPQLDDRLIRLRLWETNNNRFTLRKI
jgi:6-pyruvoyltetrahydropterin/6-carboxytetrahydropterin synthase